MATEICERAKKVVDPEKGLVEQHFFIIGRFWTRPKQSERQKVAKLGKTELLCNGDDS